jgi:hypothetical protein
MAEQYNALSMLFHPFDPRRDTPRDVGFGGPSTEYLMTERAPDFGYWNIPQIWWTPSGQPVVVEPWQANALAIEYEAASGKHFPRYPTMGVSEERAMNRSALGGSTQNALAKYGRW